MDMEVFVKAAGSPNPAIIRGLEEYFFENDALPRKRLNLHAHPSFKEFVEKETYPLMSDAKAFRAFRTCLVVAAGQCTDDDNSHSTPLGLLKLGIETEAGLLNHIAKFLPLNPSWMGRAWSYYNGEPIALPVSERQDFKNKRLNHEKRVEIIRRELHHFNG